MIKLTYAELKNSAKEFGEVKEVIPPLVYVSGLPSAFINEVIVFEDNTLGQVISIERDRIEVLLINCDTLDYGTSAVKTEESMSVPVSDKLLGHSINSLCHTMYNQYPVDHANSELCYLFKEPLEIHSRAKVTTPLETGVAVVDMLVPLGKGQRELVLGDRQIGKSQFVLQTMLNQAKEGSICIYANIGKNKQQIKEVEQFIYKHKIDTKCVVVSSSSSDPLGLIHITPYTAITIAEYFLRKGNNVLLILDDMTTHAKYYREMSLLANKFPGRNSYPGDIFYIHSQIIERGGNYIHDTGEKAISMLAIADTLEGDISGYIQTNLMSMTDGHLFFDKAIFSEGRKPPVNYFLSVTRVGRQTQDELRRSITRELQSFLALYEKSRDYMKFGSELNAGVKATITMGNQLMGFFNQEMGKITPVELQIFFFILIWSKILSDKDENDLIILNGVLQDLYTKDESFRNKVKNLVSNSTNLNELLGKLMLQKAELVDPYVKN